LVKLIYNDAKRIGSFLNSAQIIVFCCINISRISLYIIKLLIGLAIIIIDKSAG